MEESIVIMQLVKFHCTEPDSWVCTDERLHSRFVMRNHYIDLLQQLKKKMKTLHWRKKGLHFLECSVILCNRWWWVPAKYMEIILQSCQFVSASTTVYACVCVAVCQDLFQSPKRGHRMITLTCLWSVGVKALRCQYFGYTASCTHPL